MAAAPKPTPKKKPAKPRYKDKEGVKKTGRGMFKTSPEEIAAAFPKFNGNVSAAADFLGVSRGCIYEYLKKYPWLKEKLAEERERNLDELEHELYTQARNGNITALIFALKTQGRKRGYSERFEIDTKIEIDEKKKGTVKENAAHLAEVLAELEAMKAKEDKKE